MRLIDADKLACFSCTVPDKHDAKSYIEGVGFVLDRIDEAPTIDIEPVVRCRDCKHYIHKLHACCDITGAIVPMPYNAEKFFCAYGERMDGEEND